MTREEVIEFLTKINLEGGPAAYFTEYMHPKSLKDIYPKLPGSLINAAFAHEAAYDSLREELQALMEEHEITDVEVGA